MANELAIVVEKLNRIEELLNQQADEPLDLSEASKLTGLSQSFLYKLTSTNQIPHHKPRGKRIDFSKRELTKWLLQNPVKTQSEIDQQAADYVVSGKKKAAK